MWTSGYHYSVQTYSGCHVGHCNGFVKFEFNDIRKRILSRNYLSAYIKYIYYLLSLDMFLILILKKLILLLLLRYVDLIFVEEIEFILYYTNIINHI